MFRTIATWAVFAAWLIGQLFRDGSWWTALCFYLPSPLVAASLLLLAILAYRSARPRLALVSALLALGPLGCVGFVENRWHAPDPSSASSETRRLVHWNVHGGSWGWSGVTAVLKEAAADLVVLSEVPGDQSLDALAAELGNGYHHLQRGNLAVLANGPLSEEPKALPLERGQAWLVRWQDLTLLIVDLPSNPLVERNSLLKQVQQHVVECGPDIVVGDFNAPRRSRELSRLADGYAHAYDLAGSGWSYTWPAPLPLWAIDQCILGPRVQATRYELRSTLASDHCLQVLDFRSK